MVVNPEQGSVHLHAPIQILISPSVSLSRYLRVCPVRVCVCVCVCVHMYIHACVQYDARDIFEHGLAIELIAVIDEPWRTQVRADLC